MATQRAGGRVAARDKGCGAWGGRPRTSDVRYGTPVLCTHRVDFFSFGVLCGLCFVCFSGPFLSQSVSQIIRASMRF